MEKTGSGSTGLWSVVQGGVAVSIAVEWSGVEWSGAEQERVYMVYKVKQSAVEK